MYCKHGTSLIIVLAAALTCLPVVSGCSPEPNSQIAKDPEVAPTTLGEVPVASVAHGDLGPVEFNGSGVPVNVAFGFENRHPDAPYKGYGDTIVNDFLNRVGAEKVAGFEPVDVSFLASDEIFTEDDVRTRLNTNVATTRFVLGFIDQVYPLSSRTYGLVAGLEQRASVVRDRVGRVMSSHLWTTIKMETRALEKQYGPVGDVLNPARKDPGKLYPVLSASGVGFSFIDNLIVYSIVLLAEHQGDALRVVQVLEAEGVPQPIIDRVVDDAVKYTYEFV